jgi:hypothetical protein
MTTTTPAEPVGACRLGHAERGTVRNPWKHEGRVARRHHTALFVGWAVGDAHAAAIAAIRLARQRLLDYAAAASRLLRRTATGPANDEALETAVV